MNASPTLLQMKYARIVQGFQQAASLTTEEALAFFYGSQTYQLMRRGISDMHARSDQYLIEELMRERSRMN